ncbi:hypothetical protein IT398_02695 [Candidatus Nomurabacteria bacterium]|nr:hypothetical protein [Candidatus Nomurabacteria bacterium]
MLADLLKKIKSRGEEFWIIFVVLLGLGLVLGLWKKQFNYQTPEPIKIENVSVDFERTDKTSSGQVNSTATGGNFVASKNGSRYYLPGCPGVKRIKEENKIWFRTKAEAEDRGLTPAANCPGL